MRIAVALLMVFGVGVCAAYADSHERMVALWTCTLADGKTQADVQAANGKWVKHVNAAVEGGDIRSYVLTTVVGEPETFLYVVFLPQRQGVAGVENSHGVGGRQEDREGARGGGKVQPELPVRVGAERGPGVEHGRSYADTIGNSVP